MSIDDNDSINPQNASDQSPPDESGHPRSDRRSIRSFVIREGRITRGQQLALDTAWPTFGVEYQAEPLDLDALFINPEQPLTLEIGFGDGEALFEIASRDADNNFIGIEVHRPGVGHILMRVQERELSNIRIISHDAMDVLERMVQNNTLARINIYFPDPWPKKKHHKRRMIQPEFLALLASRLKPNGLLHLATDWLPYAEHMLEVLEASGDFNNTQAGNDLETACVPRPDYRPLTKFERRGQRKGHGVWDLIYRRKNTSTD